MAIEMTRRNLVASSMALAGTLSVAGTLSATQAHAEEAASANAAQAEVDAENPYDTMQADIVIAGAGGCGLACAVRAAQLGLTTVVVEQEAFTGGTSLCTEGLFAVGTHLQEEAGYDLTVKDCFDQSMNYNHWEGDGALAKEFFSTSKDNFDWLESLGVKFKYARENGKSLPTWHVYEEEEGSGLPGSLYLATMYQVAQDAGAQFVLETTAKQLVMEDGKVAGILCTNAQGTLRIDTPCVLLSTGGFANNHDMLRDIAGVDPDECIPAGVGTRNGEGIQMALDAGAILCSHPETIMCFGGQVDNSPSMSPLFAATGACPGFWFNNKGERFANEELSAINFSYSGNAIRNQKATYCLINDEMIDHMANEGIYNAVGEYIAKGEPVPSLPDDIADQLANNSENCCKGDTIEEIAEFVGCDADTLQQALDTYNGYCDEGVDEEFGKDPEWLIPVKGGSYYAFKLKLAFFTTVGGLKVSLQNEVLDADWNPIPGLYAGGSDAGGLYGASYDVSICTASQEGWAVHSGKRTAEAAARYLGKEA